MKRFFAFLALACGVALLAPPAQAAGHRVFALYEQNKSGEHGTVVLIPDGNKTIVEVALVGASGEQPEHVHEGPCSKLGGVKHALTPATDGYATTTLDVPMGDLVDKGLAVNVHKSAADLGTYVACGDLK